MNHPFGRAITCPAPVVPASKGPPVRHARLLRPASAAAALLLATLGMSALATGPVAAQAGDAKVRVAHFSSDAPPIDVYVDGKPKLRNVPFQAMSDYLTVPGGSHTFDIRAAGAAATAAPAVTVTQDFAAAKNYTVAAIGPIASISGKVYTDDLAAPAAGKARIRVIHATPSAPSVDVAVKGGAVLFPALAFGTASPYTEVAAGSYEIEVREAGKTAALLTKPVTLQSGGVYTVAAVPAANGGPNLRGFIDVAPSSTPPSVVETSTVPPTTVAGAAVTTVAGAAVPTVARAVTTVAPKNTKAVTTVAPKDTTPASTAAPAADTTADTAASDTAAADTTAADTEAASDTEAAAASTKVPPAGGVDTGFGGLTKDDGSLAPAAALVAVAAAAIGGGLLRRRRTRH